MAENTVSEGFRLDATASAEAARIAKYHGLPKARWYRQVVEDAVTRAASDALDTARAHVADLAPRLALLGADTLTVHYDPDLPANQNAARPERRRVIAKVGNALVPDEIATADHLGTVSRLTSLGGTPQVVLYLRHPAGPMAFLARVWDGVPATVSIPIDRLADLTFIDADNV